MKFSSSLLFSSLPLEIHPTSLLSKTVKLLPSMFVVQERTQTIPVSLHCETESLLATFLLFSATGFPWGDVVNIIQVLSKSIYNILPVPGSKNLQT